MKRHALSRALLLGTALGCSPLPMTSLPHVGGPGSGDGGADAGEPMATADASVDGGSDAGLVKLYCWLIADPRCFADGGTAVGTFDAC